MNIFITNLDPELCALEHCQTHVVKQILENYQMLSTVQRKYIGERAADDLGLYKKAHHHHPATLWVGESKANYEWLMRLTVAMGEVYEVSRGKVHASQQKLLDKLSEPPVGIPDIGWTSPALCMPDRWKEKGGYDVCKSYHHYLNAKFIEWTTRTDKRKIKPVWWAGEHPQWVEPVTGHLIESMEK